VPALRRGLAEVSAPTVLVLAADLHVPPARHLRALLALDGGSTSGVIMVDDTGRPQWLASCWDGRAQRGDTGPTAELAARAAAPLEPLLSTRPRSATIWLN